MRRSIAEAGHRYVNRSHLPYMVIVDVRDPWMQPIYNELGEPSVRVMMIWPDDDQPGGWRRSRNRVQINPVYRNPEGRRFVHNQNYNHRYFLDEFEVFPPL